MQRMISNPLKFNTSKWYQSKCRLLKIMINNQSNQLKSKKIKMKSILILKIFILLANNQPNQS